jgi:ABC-type dipeptide/oligopeptide/nickel transport system permease component
MLVYTIRRLILMLPILFGVLLVTYTLGFYGPGDPLVIMFGEEERIPDPEILARLKRIHGLDRPFFVQFGDYLGVWKNNKGEYDGLLQGNFGTSLIDKRPVNEKIRIGMPVSFQLGIAAGVVMIVVGVPLGILAAVKQNSWIDYSIIAGAIAVRSVPVFVLAPMLMILLVLKLDVLSKVPIGWHGIFAQAAILPVGLMAATSILLVIRMARAGIIEVLSENYVRTARAKGLLERTVLTRHVMKNSMTPVLTSMGLALSGLVTGAIFVELIFAVPGLALAGITAFRSRDYPVILAVTVIGGFFIIMANLLVDLGYGLLDPRVRYE